MCCRNFSVIQETPVLALDDVGGEAGPMASSSMKHGQGLDATQ